MIDLSEPLPGTDVVGHLAQNLVQFPTGAAGELLGVAPLREGEVADHVVPGQRGCAGPVLEPRGGTGRSDRLARGGDSLELPGLLSGGSHRGEQQAEDRGEGTHRGGNVTANRRCGEGRTRNGVEPFGVRAMVPRPLSGSNRPRA